MGFNSIEVVGSTTLTEIEYLQNIIDAIVSIDPRITCNTTSSAQFADLTSASTATFTFDVDGKYQIVLTRGKNNGTPNANYKFNIVVNGTDYVASTSIRFFSGNMVPTGSVGVNAHFKVSAYTTDHEVLLWFGADGYGSAIPKIPSSYSTILICDSENDYYCGAVDSSNDVVGSTLYKCDDETSGFQIAKLLDYAENTGDISIVKNVFNPIIKPSGISLTKDLYGCSTIAIGSAIVADGDTYFAVGSNLLCKEV
jgi:hypothetical protein